MLTGDGTVVATMEGGSFFGEISLVFPSIPRTATVESEARTPAAKAFGSLRSMR